MLYKLYNPSSEVVAIVRYLSSIGKKEVAPYHCQVELPDWSDTVAIETLAGDRYIGLNQVIRFYEQLYKVEGVLTKGEVLVALSPDFRCTVTSPEWESMPVDF